MKRSAFGDVTNKGSELDRDDKRHHASTEGQLAEAPPSEEASSLAEAPEPLSEWPEEETYPCAKTNCCFGGIITGDQPAAVCDKCGDFATATGFYHVKCADLKTAPAYYTCPVCKAEEDAKELADLKKNGDSAFVEKPAPPKRKTAGGGGSQKRLAAGAPACKKRPCRMNDDERAEHEQAKADKKAKEDAAGADELEAAVADFEASSWVEEDNYVAVVDELQSWVARGGTAATAAGWIGRLMIATKQAPKGKGGEGYTPHTVRKRYKAIWPGAAS